MRFQLKMSNSSDKDFFLNRTPSVFCKTPLRERVKLLLLAKGENQEWLARVCSVNSGTISKILNGFWIPSSLLMMKMSKELGVDTLVLFGDEPYWKEYNEKIREKKLK